MKTSLPTTLFALLLTITTHSQVISNFTWESGPVTKAITGPNGISVSSSAVISANGATGNGLNPGLPKKDIELVLPGTPYFDVPGIDISVSFRMEETQASFFKRGNLFDFGVEGGKLNAKFRVSDGNGGSTQVNASNVYTIPNDHAFHTYRFVYNSNTGKAEMSVDGRNVYTYTGTAQRVLYWTGGGNVVIGTQMDATGGNVAILDNFLVQNVPVISTLPVKLTSFNAQPQTNAVALNWITTKEEGFNHFVLERSADGVNYAPIATIFAAGGVNTSTAYNFTDKTPATPVSYYRLKMIDTDGQFSYSEIRTASFGSAVGSAAISCFPNPAKDVVNLRINNTATAQYRYTLVALNGKVQDSKVFTLTRGQQQYSVNLAASVPTGVYMLEVENINTRSKEAFKIVKL